MNHGSQVARPRKRIEAIGVYYNENDPFAAAWLREIIAAGELPDGDVDTRSIVDVRARDLAGYVQCHFFAGIGGWPLALRWAGVATDSPLWTGSCPCQPFSGVGKRKGTSDERHLWPAFKRLIAHRRPPVVFGEQVASKDGRLWLDGVRADMESLGYAFGAADLCAAGVSAPHIRQRLYWVGHAVGARLEGHAGNADRGGEPGRIETHAVGPVGPPGLWADRRLVACRDAKSRPIESSIQPVAYGVSGRVGKLRGYGNAIVPKLAAEFVQAYIEASCI